MHSLMMATKLTSRGEFAGLEGRVMLWMGGGRGEGGGTEWIWGETTLVSSLQMMDEDAFTDDGNEADQQGRVCWLRRQGDVVNRWRETCCVRVKV